VIEELSPDVVALQEIGDEEPLQDLQEALGDAYLHRAVSAFPDGRGIKVAFLSQFAIQERTDLADFPAGPALVICELSAAGEPSLVSAGGEIPEPFMEGNAKKSTSKSWTVSAIVGTSHVPVGFMAASPE
jgi:hypothetical protein